MLLVAWWGRTWSGFPFTRNRTRFSDASISEPLVEISLPGRGRS